MRMNNLCLVKKFFLWKKSFFLLQKNSFLVLGKLFFFKFISRIIAETNTIKRRYASAKASGQISNAANNIQFLKKKRVYSNPEIRTPTKDTSCATFKKNDIKVRKHGIQLFLSWLVHHWKKATNYRSYERVIKKWKVV